MTGACRTCVHWMRKTKMGETGDCYCPERKPDPEYGRLTLDSDGCKHHLEEPTMDEPRDQY